LIYIKKPQTSQPREFIHAGHKGHEEKKLTKMLMSGFIYQKVQAAKLLAGNIPCRLDALKLLAYSYE
jgi:hypothetical protein